MTQYFQTQQARRPLGRAKAVARPSAPIRQLLALGLLLAMAGFYLLTSSAQAQDWGSREQQLQDRIARLESALQDLQAKVYSLDNVGGEVPYENRSYGETYATDGGGSNLALRLDTIELEMQRLTGRLETLAYQIDRQQEQLDALTKAMENANNRQGAYGGADMVSSGDGFASDTTSTYPTPSIESGTYGDMESLPAPQDSASAPETRADGAPQDLTKSSLPALPSDPAEAYSLALQSLLAGHYEEAETGFSAFLQQFPDNERAPDAKFRLGEIYLVTGDYGRAASTFLDHIQTWPNDARAPESYLKLGTAFSRAGKTAEACQVFNALKTKYPKASASVLQRLQIERQRAGC